MGQVQILPPLPIKSTTYKGCVQEMSNFVKITALAAGGLVTQAALAFGGFLWLVWLWSLFQ